MSMNNKCNNIKEMINKGFVVIPLCSGDHRGMTPSHIKGCQSPGKRPLISKWTEINNVSVEQFEIWNKQFPTANWGLVLGKTDSHNLLGIDIDGEEGERYWQEITKNKDLPNTVEFSTGAGRRLLYELPKDLETKKQKVTLEGNHAEVAFCCQGQQTVIPPSIHNTGRVYEWVEGQSIFDIEIAEAPKWMIDIVSITNTNSNNANISNTESIINIDFTKVKSGSRNNTLFSHIINIAEHRAKTTDKYILLTLATVANNSMPEPLDDKEVETIVDSAIKTLLDNEMEAKGSYGGALYSSLTVNKNNTVSVNQSIAGDAILNEYDFINNERFFYKFNPNIGIWEKYSKQALSSLITKDLKKYCNNFWSDSVVRGLTSQVFNNTYSIEDGRSFDQVFNKNPYNIVFKNGTLNLKTGIFEEAFYKEDYNTIIIPHNYNEKADRPIKTINFLSMMTDSTEEMTFIFEWIGYLLVKSYPIAKMLFLVGNGGNGKSTLIKLMTSIVGENNTSAVSIKSLVNNRFQGALLYNKLFNTVADIGADFFEDSSIIKALTGDDTITVERKGENGFSYSNFAKMTYSCNKLPKFKDNSAGLERRPIILNLNKDFMDIVQSSGMHINDIINDEEEIEKIIAYSVVNFMRVLENNNTFTESDDMRKAKSDWLNDDPLVDFIYEVYTPTGCKDNFIQMKEFMDQYRQYCAERNYKPLNQKNVIEAIKHNKIFINENIKPVRVSNKGSQYKIIGLKF